MRLLYEYMRRRTSQSSQTTQPSATEYIVYRKNDKRWMVAFVLPCAEWDELNQALFGLVHKLLHNAHRPEFKTNAKAERNLLEMLSFDVWTSWIGAPVTNDAILSFDSRQTARDVATVQAICNTVSKGMFPGLA
jgi:hypothetical protein